jgi:hypothetical protein
MRLVFLFAKNVINFLSLQITPHTLALFGAGKAPRDAGMRFIYTDAQVKTTR